MAKYTHQQRMQVLHICAEYNSGKLTYAAAESKVRTKVPIYPYVNLKGEMSRLKEYTNGRGRYGYGYPATWARALIELSGNSVKVINALKEQQRLYLEHDGKNNRTMAKLLEGL